MSSERVSDRRWDGGDESRVAALRSRVHTLEEALEKPLKETILAVLLTMPSDAAPEHLARMIELQVRAFQALDLDKEATDGTSESTPR